MRGQGRTLREIAKVMNVTPERIRQIETRAFRLQWAAKDRCRERDRLHEEQHEVKANAVACLVAALIEMRPFLPEATE
jgi:DNA-directed RNA polymerase sigma subunit (sigma70/sigma32)